MGSPLWHPCWLPDYVLPAQSTAPNLHNVKTSNRQSHSYVFDSLTTDYRVDYSDAQDFVMIMYSIIETSVTS